MLDKGKLAGKTAFVKLVGDDFGRSLAVALIEDGGVWFRDEALALDCLKLTKDAGRPMFLQDKSPLIFLPHHQIDWIMFAEKDSRQENQ